MKNKNAHTSKFDIAITNPPYCKDLHLHILKDLVPHCEETISISPIRWLQDPLAKYKKNSDYNKFKESLSLHLVECEIVRNYVAENEFDAKFAVNLAITKFDNEEHSEFETVNSDSIVDKVKKLWKRANIETDKLDGWRVRLPAFTKHEEKRTYNKLTPLGKLFVFFDGKKDGRKWWTYWNINQHTKKTNEISYSIKFDTEQEGINFIESLNTNFGRYVCYKIAWGGTISGSNLLWMGDYKEPWTDERFYDYYNMSQEERNRIEKTVNEIYGDDAI